MDHHAQLLYGESIGLSALPAEYAVPSADITHFVSERFTIDDARELKTLAEARPLAAPFRVFVIAARTIAPEAQQALLKLFEEPPQSARFFVIAAPTMTILPTLRSRLGVPAQASSAQKEAPIFAEFLKSGYAARLEEIAARTKEKDASWIEAIVSGSEAYASGKQIPDLLRAAMLCRRYLPYRGASPKMLLESLALRLPLGEV